MKKILAILCILFFASSITALASSAKKEMTIVETAVSAGSFNTLVAAVKAADLVDTLNGAGPFTVFAPTDEAFAKLPAGTLEELMVDNAKVVKTDIVCSNGVIHVIDTVVLPK